MGVTAGIGKIPSAGMEAVPLEFLDPGNAGKLGQLQRPRGHHEIFCANRIAMVGGDNPPGRLFVPTRFLYRGLKEGVVVKAELAGNGLGMRHDFGAAGVIRLGHDAHFLKQRHIDIGFGVAGNAGIPVPIPHPAKIGGLVDDADIIDTGLAQVYTRMYSTPATTEDRHLDIF